jgi:hypothetical protein
MPGPVDEPVGERGAEIHALIGVYHANGSLRGELAYLFGKLSGRAHCALCDITHGPLRRRPGFDACVATLPVAFDLVHLDERSDDVTAACDGRTPCVLARTGAGLVVLVDAEELAACGGDPARLRSAIERSAATLGMRWPT